MTKSKILIAEKRIAPPQCTCGHRYGCELNENPSDEELQKYFDRVSEQDSNYAPGIMGLWFEINPRQIKMLTNYIHNHHEIYALHFNHHHITKAQAKAIIECQHLKQLIFRRKPSEEILDILYQRPDWMLVLRGDPHKLLQVGTDPEDDSEWASLRKYALDYIAKSEIGEVTSLPIWAARFHTKAHLQWIQDQKNYELEVAKRLVKQLKEKICLKK